MVQNRFETGMYVVDTDFRIVSINNAMAELYPEVHLGDICYRAIAMQNCQCATCPLKTDNALFYNPIRREWIYANAAEIDYPGHGLCYSVQFQKRLSVTVQSRGALQEENMEEHVLELSGGNMNACALAGYCAPGSPLSYANEPLLRLLGYSTIEELSQDVDGLVLNTIHPDDMDRVTRDLTRCAQQGGLFETTYRMHRKDHTWFWVVGRGKRVETRSGEYVLLAVITDMTEFVKRQNELREQNQQLLQEALTSQAVLEHMPGGYHRCAPKDGWPFLYVSASFEEITGWTREEIRTELDNQFTNMVLPEDYAICAGIVANIQKTGYSNAIYRVRRRDGQIIWVSDSTMKVELGEETFYHGTLANVTPQITELENARQEAEASSQAKSAFLFNASHDIRTPMNAILGFAHIIKENVHHPQRVLDTVHKLQESGQVLMTLMNVILELARIERGKETVDRRPLDMQAHVDKLYEMMAQEMAESRIDFRVENELPHPLVFADDLKLTRIAMNLLSNARKFTPAGGRVTFGVKESDFDGENAVYTLFVEDTGIGMSKEFQARAFDQFEQERSSTVSGVSGSGLGLAIIRKISELVGGRCHLESELGKGTRITCSVPLRIAEASDFSPAPLTAESSFNGRRLLLAEDNDFNREIARYVFENLGFEVEEAENGVICLEKLIASPAGHFDLILMDVQMPVMDGLTATREIRSLNHPIIAGTPIIATTANAFEEDRQRCLEAGMDGHIGKPLDATAVVMELNRVLQR